MLNTCQNLDCMATEKEDYSSTMAFIESWLESQITSLIHMHTHAHTHIHTCTHTHTMTQRRLLINFMAYQIS